MKKSLLLLISICSVTLLSGCGGGSSAPPVATHFSVTAATTTATAGTPFNITVTALDASGGLVSTFNGAVAFASSDAKAVFPASGTLASGTGTFSVTFKTAGSQTITATYATLTGSSPPVMVSASAPTQFSVVAPAIATAGTAFSFTVTAQDASNNPVTSYSGTVHLTSTDARAVLPADSTLTNGTATFSATFKTAANQTITATDTVTASITGISNNAAVSPAATTHFTVTAPTAATTGIQINFTVTALDAYANTATNYTGTVHFSTTDTQATVPANSALANGVATPPITLKTIGSATITATDTTTASITGNSNSVTVVSNAPTHFAVLTPANTTTRASFNVTVNALDAANNVSIGYVGTVHFTSTDAQALLPANSTLPSGTKNFSATLETAGNQTITATDTVTASLTGPSPAIAVTAAAALAITSGTPPSGTFGVIYGPSTTTTYRCSFTSFPIITINCTPCVPSSSCSSLPICSRYHPQYPCRQSRTVSDGFPLVATGGVPPYTWSAPSLPPGLGFTLTSGNNYLAGTPTSPGTYTVALTVTDSGTPKVTTSPITYTIVISEPPPPVINATPAPPSGAVNLPYSFTFTASTTAPPLTWRLSAGTLPAGLTLSSTGVLSGTPTTVGTSSITLIATDEFKQDSAPQVFAIQIFAHGFKATGSMGTARTAAIATLLNTGKALVAGGTDPAGNSLASAELYDPTTGTFSPTGSMAAGRAHFAAALLPSGKVLVTGGLDSAGNPLATAELYDPTAGTFSPTTNNMTIARASHTATLLNTGKVLIAGWGNAIAELFDPATGTFTQTGSMLAPRVSHTATLLNNGKVLITGGIGGNLQVLTEAELYDPATGSFSATLGSMATARQWHTATLLNDGTVLVTGGMNSNAGQDVATAELFNLTTQSFTATKGPMETPRAFQTANLLKDGTVLIIGGDDGTGPLASAEIYDPTAGTFSPTASLGSARESHNATSLSDGTVLVTGGTGTTGVLASAELYQ